ncbi:hypothetical protein D3C77_464280 [compost metagenome]
MFQCRQIVAAWTWRCCLERLERDGQLILLLAESGLRCSLSTLRLAQRHDLRLQRRESVTQSIDIAAQGGRWIRRGIAGRSLKLGQLLVMVVRFGGEHRGAQAQGTDHQGLKMEDLHGVISSVEKGGAGGGTRRA